MGKTPILQSNIHHGNNIQRLRNYLGYSSEWMAEQAGIPLHHLLIIETLRIIDDNMITKFSEILQVPAPIIKNMEKETPTINVTNNTFTDNQNVSNIGNYNMQDSSTNIFNPIDTIVDLYERLLNSTRLNNEDLVSRINNIEKKVLKN